MRPLPYEVMLVKRRELPSEDEQFRAYRDGIVAMAGRPVTLRTLDLGSMGMSSTTPSLIWRMSVHSSWRSGNASEAK